MASLYALDAHILRCGSEKKHRIGRCDKGYEHCHSWFTLGYIQD